MHVKQGIIWSTQQVVGIITIIIFGQHLFLCSWWAVSTQPQKITFYYQYPSVDWSSSNSKVIGGNKDTRQEAGEHRLCSRLLANGVWPHVASLAALASGSRVESGGVLELQIATVTSSSQTQSFQEHDHPYHLLPDQGLPLEQVAF